MLPSPSDIYHKVYISPMIDYSVQMVFKKLISIGTILTCLAGGAYAKNYDSGIETQIEKKHNIDLIGDFSKKEIKNISKVIGAIEKNVDRKSNGIGYFTIRNIDSHNEKLGDGDVGYANAVAEADINTIFMSTSAINGRKFKQNPLANYKGLLAHEIGHLIFPEYSKEIEDVFWDLNRLPKSKVTDGYVTEHPLNRPFFHRLNEDFADIFSYMINRKKYANNDSIVQKKIKFVERKVWKKSR